MRSEPLLFHNLRDGRFDEVGLRGGPALGQPRVSRGLSRRVH